MNDLQELLYVPSHPGQGESVAPAFKQSGGGGSSSLPPMDTAFSVYDSFINYNTEVKLGSAQGDILTTLSEGALHFDNNSTGFQSGDPAGEPTLCSWDKIRIAGGGASGTGVLPLYVGKITQWTIRFRGCQTDASWDFWMLFAWTPDATGATLGSGYAARFTNAGAPENRLYRIDDGAETLIAQYNGTMGYHDSYDNQIMVRFDPSSGSIQSGFSVNSAGGFTNVASATDTTYEGGKVGFQWQDDGAAWVYVTINDFAMSGLGSDDS